MASVKRIRAYNEKKSKKTDMYKSDKGSKEKAFNIDIYIENLSCLIENSGISRFKIAKDTGISEAYFYNILSHRVGNPDIDKVYRLATYFGVSIDWLVGKEYAYKADGCVCPKCEHVRKGVN